VPHFQNDSIESTTIVSFDGDVTDAVAIQRGFVAKNTTFFSMNL
jgi:hypothetical protein